MSQDFVHLESDSQILMTQDLSSLILDDFTILGEGSKCLQIITSNLNFSDLASG